MNSHAALVDEVIINEELSRRPGRPADFEAESRALVALAEVMAESPRAILQTLADTALELCRADSAGISIEEIEAEKGIFRWQATAGAYAPYLGGTMPRHFSPCGTVLDRNATLLMADPVRFYPYIEALSPPVVEVLLIPFYRGDRPIGTIWAVAHTGARRFDSEDARLLKSLSRFASAAVQTLRNLEAIEIADRELRDARSRLDAALEAGAIATWTWDIVNDRVVADRNLARLFALSPEDAAGGPIARYLEAIHPDDREAAARVIDEAVRSGSNYEAEYRLTQAEGSCRWVVARGRPEYDARGKPRSLSGAIVDITERKRAEEELRANDERKDEFLAMLAHELRNPLAAISNAVAASTRGGLERHHDWAMGVVSRQVGHLTRLIDDLLDVSRISRGKITLRRDVHEVTSVLESAAATARPLVEERRHTLEIEVERGDLWADVDPTRLEQAVVNLLNNAAKYSEDGGHIRLAARNEGGEVVISVRDRGVGIPPEKLPQMFELFAQGDRSLARSEGGLGVGLTIVKKLVEMHGGTIEAVSEGRGRGSLFTIRLPRVSRPADPSREPGAASPAGAASARILVIDDSVDMAVGMVTLLQLLGHEARVAHSGPEGLAVARELRPEFVLLDIGLPGMDGYEVASRLRREECCRDAVLVAVSGYGQEQDRRRSKEAGFDHHLIKPVDHDELFALLAGVVVARG